MTEQDAVRIGYHRTVGRQCVLAGGRQLCAHCHKQLGVWCNNNQEEHVGVCEGCVLAVLLTRLVIAE